jgi:hypothetical protein
VGKQPGIDVLYRLTDLDEPHPDRIEHQSVVEPLPVTSTRGSPRRAPAKPSPL